MKLYLLAFVLVAGVIAEPESKPESKADADALFYYNTYGYWPVGYTGSYYTHPYAAYNTHPYPAYHYLGKRDADSDPKAVSKADADALYYYNTYGNWPVGYTGYYTHPYSAHYTHPYSAYHYLGKRDADSAPKAVSKADADALYYYNTYGNWPVGYTGYYTHPYSAYYTHPYSAYHYLGKRDAESTPEGKSDADAQVYYNTYGYYPSWYHGGYYNHGYGYANYYYGK